MRRPVQTVSPPARQSAYRSCLYTRVGVGILRVGVLCMADLFPYIRSSERQIRH